MAAHGHINCVWMLMVGACVSAALQGTDCGKQCAMCVYRLLGQHTALSSLTCSLECDGGLDSQKLRLCRDFLVEEENQIPLDANQNQQQQEQEALGEESEETSSPDHQLAKKYGGFMKRYGGFMSRRSSSSEGAAEAAGNQNEESVRLEILKLLNAATEHGGEGEAQGPEAIKRYGGFMRRAQGGVAHSDLLEAVLGRGLKKRYGGFMRRVGRPEWLLDSSKSGGSLKRAWVDDGELQKRYGGFMD